MLKKVVFAVSWLSLLIIPFLIFSSLKARAQDDENRYSGAATDPQYKKENGKIALRPGMESKKMGGLHMVVPEGTQRYKEAGQWKMEDPEVYAARNFKEVKNRLDQLEKNQQKLQDDLDTLKEALNKSAGRATPT